MPNLRLKKAYQNKEMSHPPMNDPSIDTPCPTNPVQNPTEYDAMPTSTKNSGIIVSAPCSPEIKL
jgi:hypothetical protein